MPRRNDEDDGSNDHHDKNKDKDDDDDYMTMKFSDDEDAVEQDEGAPSTELARPESVRKIEKSLETPLAAEDSKAMKMMQKMGYQPGQSLGKEKEKDGDDVVVVKLKTDRGGIGAETATKRKLQQAHDEYQSEQKRAKGEFIDTRRDEAETRRVAKLVKSAGSVLTQLETDKVDDTLQDESGDRIDRIHDPWEAFDSDGKDEGFSWEMYSLPARSFVYQSRRGRLWTELRNARMHESHDKQAIREIEDRYQCYVNDEMYTPQQEFLAQAPQAQLDAVQEELREKYDYCYWCGAHGLDECPGFDEEDHK